MLFKMCIQFWTQTKLSYYLIIIIKLQFDTKQSSVLRLAKAFTALTHDDDKTNQMSVHWA